ncbi:MAG: zinc-binding dehydrogenase [Bacillota bacterium]|nr:zinc-binding dehydrogenase [Bacillota bacterium]
MQAKAVVAIKPFEVVYLDVTVPDPSASDVVVRVEQSWISNGTEGSFVRGERIAGDTPRQDTDPEPFPMVPGYQKVGVVEWAGSAVKHVSVGDRVFATVSRVNGMFYPTGGHVSPAITHASQVWPIPDGVDPTAVSGLVLTQVGYNCGIRPTVGQGDVAVVIGDGMVGHWAAQTLAWRGARVVLLGRHPERLNLFDQSGGHITIRADEPDAIGKIAAFAPQGVQAVIDTVGSVAAIEQLYPLIRPFGHIVSAGFHGRCGHIDIQPMRAKELTLHAPAGWTKERMDATLQLITDGAIKTEHLITHHFPVCQADAAFNMILSRKEPFLGVILDWEGKAL